MMDVLKPGRGPRQDYCVYLEAESRVEGDQHTLPNPEAVPEVVVGNQLERWGRRGGCEGPTIVCPHKYPRALESGRSKRHILFVPVLVADEDIGVVPPAGRLFIEPEPNIGVHVEKSVVVHS